MKSIGELKPKPLWMHNRDVETSCAKWTADEILFFVAFFSFTVKFTFDYTSLAARNEMLNTILTALCVISSIIKIARQRYTLSRLVCTVAICAIIGYSSYISVNNLFLYSFLLMIAMQDIKVDKVVKASLYMKIVTLSFHVLIYISVFMTNPESINFVYRGSESTIPRHTFFMGHANTFSAFLVWACIDYIFIKYKKLKAAHMAVIWVINISFYAFTYTNSVIIVLLLITVLVAMDKLGKGFFDNLFTVMSKYGYIVFTLMFAFLTAIYTRLNAALMLLWNKLDSFMTGRLWYGAYAYDFFGPTILGRTLKGIPEKIFWHGRWQDIFYTFDSHYLGYLYQYGIINLVLTGIALFILSKKMETREKIIIIAFSVYAIMEAYVTNVVVCSALFIIGKHILIEGHKETI